MAQPPSASSSFSSLSSLSSSQILTECAICQGRLKSPKSLPCFHSFCLSCLEDMVKHDKEKDKTSKSLHCPICRTTVPLPEKGISQLPSNPFIQSILLQPSSSQPSDDPNNLLCELCQEDDSTSFCLQCAQFFCASCHKIHLRQNVSRKHEIISADEAFQREERRIKFASVFCEHHPGFEIDSFCKECGVAICPACIPLSHSYHGFVSVKQIAEDFVQQMNEKLEEANQKSIEFIAQMAEIRRQIETFDDQAQLAEEKLKQTIKRLREAIDAREAELFEELNLLKQHQKKKLKLDLEDSEFTLNRFQSAKDFIGALLSEGSGLQVVLNRTLALEQLERIREDMKKMDVAGISFDDDHEELECILSLLKTFGTAYAQRQISVEHSVVQLSSLKSRLSLGEITSFTVLLVDIRGKKISSLPLGFSVTVDGPAFVVPVLEPLPTGHIKATFTPPTSGKFSISVTLEGQHLPSSPFTVDCFKPKTPDYNSLKTVTVKFGSNGSENREFQDVRSIASNSRQEILVMDSKNHRVQVFDKEGKFLFKFGTKGEEEGEFDGPYGIAVDPLNDRIVVADSGNSRIQVFDPIGSFLFAFGSHGSEPGEFQEPWGCAVDDQGKIYVSDYQGHCVQVFDKDGHFLLKFGEEGSEPGMLNSPLGIAVDSKGNIVVSENMSARVSVFDSQGTYLRSMGSDRMSYPRYLCLDAEDRILVTDCGKGRVDVYDPQGNFLLSIGEKADLKGPEGICIDTESRLVISEYRAERVSVFSP